MYKCYYSTYRAITKFNALNFEMPPLQVYLSYLYSSLILMQRLWIFKAENSNNSNRFFVVQITCISIKNRMLLEVNMDVQKLCRIWTNSGCPLRICGCQVRKSWKMLVIQANFVLLGYWKQDKNNLLIIFYLIVLVLRTEKKKRPAQNHVFHKENRMYSVVRFPCFARLYIKKIP